MRGGIRVIRCPPHPLVRPHTPNSQLERTTSNRLTSPSTDCHRCTESTTPRPNSAPTFHSMHFTRLALVLPILGSALALALVAPVGPVAPRSKSVDLPSAHLAKRDTVLSVVQTLQSGVVSGDFPQTVVRFGTRRDVVTPATPFGTRRDVVAPAMPCRLVLVITSSKPRTSDLLSWCHSVIGASSI